MDDKKDKPEFATAIGAMCAAFGTDASKALMLGYWMGLQDLTLQAVQGAVARSIRECERLPAPVELRRLAGERTAEAGAIAAWGDVLKAIPLGPYRHVDFDDRLINATVRNLGGWPTFLGRLVDVDSEKWLRIEFVKCYAMLANSGVSGEMCAALPGLSVATVRNGSLVAAVARRIACTSPGAARLLSTPPTPQSRIKEPRSVQHSGAARLGVSAWQTGILSMAGCDE